MTDQVPPPSHAPRERTAVRWWLAIGSIVVGGLFLVASGLIAHDQTYLREGGASFWSGLFVNIGTTLLLAAGLIGLERVIVRKVREDRLAAVEQAAEIAAESAAQRASAAFQVQLDDLDRRIWEQASSAESERAASAVRVGESGSFEAVRNGLRSASEINAIARPDSHNIGGIVTVPAGFEDVGVSGPTIEVLYMPDSPASAERISLRYATLRSSSFLDWELGEAPEAVFLRLQQAMLRDGYGRERRQMSAERFFANLSSTLLEAGLARHGGDGLWLSGNPVHEKVTDQIFITSAGIETPSGVLVEAWRYGRQIQSIDGTYYLDEDLEVTAPEGVDQAALDVAIERGRRYFQPTGPRMRY